MAIVTDRAYGQILSMALADRSPGIQDLVFNSNPVTAILRQKGLFKPYNGPEIRQSLTIDKFLGQWFTGFDKLNNEPKEIVNDAVWTPKRVAVGISLNGTEILANRGRAEVHDVLSTYMENAENSMSDTFETAIHGNGTADGGRQMIGFGGALPIITNSGMYGGINRATVPIWQTTTYEADTDFTDIGAGWDSTTARPILERCVALRSKGKRYASIAIADLAAYQALSQSMVAHQRIARDDGAPGTLGFRGLEVATPVGNVEVFCATGVNAVMPSNTIYGIDPESLRVRYHPDNNMVPLFPGDGAMPVNQDAIAQYLVWTGEMTLINPRFSWRLVATPPSP